MNVLGDWIKRQVQEDRVASLKAIPVADLKALWDRCPTDGSMLVDGHDLDEVYLALCLLGHGDYCGI